MRTQWRSADLIAAMPLPEADGVLSGRRKCEVMSSACVTVLQRELPFGAVPWQSAHAAKAKHRLAANEPFLLDLFLKGLRSRSSN